MKTTQYRLSYTGSKFWLIVWVLCFFPIALALFATGVCAETANGRYQLKYLGSRFWLFAWSLLFFPVAILLFIINGCAVVRHYNDCADVF